MNHHYDGVSLKNLQRFLKIRGWSVKDHPNRNISYYESKRESDGDFSSIVIPASEHYSDFGNRITDALRTIARYEKTSIEKIKSSIERWDRDVLRTRIFERHQNIHSLPLNLTFEVVESLKDFLGGAAYTEYDPKKFFVKAGRISTDFISHCRFGHTFEGSFGLQIECPLPDVGQASIADVAKEAPFERLVMQRIANGYNTIQDAVKKDDPAELVTTYQSGFNANMMQALMSVYEKLDTKCIEYSIEWASELAPSPETMLTTPLTFDGKVYEYVKYAARELEKEEDATETTVMSRIVSLRSEMPPSEDEQEAFEHVITLNWEKTQGVNVKLRVPLKPAEYKKACDAHKNGQKIIIRGTPMKEGKFWMLTNTSEIQFSTF